MAGVASVLWLVWRWTHCPQKEQVAINANVSQHRNALGAIRLSLPSLRIQRGGSEDQRPRAEQVRTLGPSETYPWSQRYSSTVPTGNQLLLVSVRLVELCCTIAGLTQPERHPNQSQWFSFDPRCDFTASEGTTTFLNASTISFIPKYEVSVFSAASKSLYRHCGYSGEAERTRIQAWCR